MNKVEISNKQPKKKDVKFLTINLLPAMFL